MPNLQTLIVFDGDNLGYDTLTVGLLNGVPQLFGDPITHGTYNGFNIRLSQYDVTQSEGYVNTFTRSVLDMSGNTSLGPVLYTSASEGDWTNLIWPDKQVGDPGQYFQVLIQIKAWGASPAISTDAPTQPTIVTLNGGGIDAGFYFGPEFGGMYSQMLFMATAQATWNTQVGATNTENPYNAYVTMTFNVYVPSYAESSANFIVQFPTNTGWFSGSGFIPAASGGSVTITQLAFNP